MSGTGRHIRDISPASAILDLFPYPALLIEKLAFKDAFDGYRLGVYYRSDNPHKRGTLERHEWRAGWDYGELSE